MNLYWTSKYPINGLRHFVCVNEIKEEGKWNVLLVSVLDIEVHLTVSKKELDDHIFWENGWSELNKSESITKEYISFKQRKNSSEHPRILLSKSSPFKINEKHP
tara:strand:+ start:150 stop:461 length:312 start_codon:yes stop_codon:yes gene_type:complete